MDIFIDSNGGGSESSVWMGAVLLFIENDECPIIGGKKNNVSDKFVQ